jgi:hypothetical protein
MPYEKSEKPGLALKLRVAAVSERRESGGEGVLHSLKISVDKTQ